MGGAIQQAALCSLGACGPLWLLVISRVRGGGGGEEMVAVGGGGNWTFAGGGGLAGRQRRT